MKPYHRSHVLQSVVHRVPCKCAAEVKNHHESTIAACERSEVRLIGGMGDTGDKGRNLSGLSRRWTEKSIARQPPYTFYRLLYIAEACMGR